MSVFSHPGMAGPDVTPMLEEAGVTAPSSNTASIYKTQATTHTFSSIGIGDPHPARQVVVSVGATDGAVDGVCGAISSVTCNTGSAVAMTEVVKIGAGNRATAGIFSIRQSDLSNPNATTASFAITLANAAPFWSLCSHRLLSYDLAPATGSQQAFASLQGTQNLYDSAISQDAGSALIGVYSWGGNDNDAMEDNEHTWLTLLTESDQKFYSIQFGTGDTVFHASADYASAISSVQQRHQIGAAGQSQPPNWNASCIAAWAAF